MGVSICMFEEGAQGNPVMQIVQLSVIDVAIDVVIDVVIDVA